MIRVLVVDDEPISALAVGQYLEDCGFHVRIAGSGRQALELGEESPPDILVSDWKLQDEIDGLELVRRLTHRNAEMKSIIISGLTAADVPDEDVKKLIFRFLTKPCGINNVLDTVKEALASRHEPAKHARDSLN